MTCRFPLHFSSTATVARPAARGQRVATPRCFAAIVDGDRARPLYLREGCSSLFTYCTQVAPPREGAHTTASRRPGQRGGFAMLEDTRRRHGKSPPPPILTAPARESVACHRSHWRQGRLGGRVHAARQIFGLVMELETESSGTWVRTALSSSRREHLAVRETWMVPVGQGGFVWAQAFSD